jgi:outer membrane protein assembly factor BamA
MGTPKKENSIRGRLKYKFGEPPVLLRDVDLEHNEKVLANTLENQGFFQARVEGDTIVKKRKGRAVYKAEAGIQYMMKEVVFEKDSSQLNKNILEVADRSLLKSGDPFNLERIIEERERIDVYLKEKGYYFFNPDYIIIRTDSTIGNNEVNMYIRVKPEAPPDARKIYTMNKIYIFTNYTLKSPAADTNKFEGTYHHGYYLVDQKKMYRPILFQRVMMFKPYDIYDRTRHNMSINRLITLGMFKFVKNRFEVAAGLDSPKLNTYYYLTPLPKKALKVELNFNTKSNNLTGSAISIGWRNRNTFKAGELLSITALGGMEVQYSGLLKGFNTYRGGLEGRFVIPRFVVPFMDLNTGSGFVPKTTIMAGYDLLYKQQLYTLNSFRSTFGYTWKENVYKEHILNPVSITFVQPIKVTDLYLSQMEANPTLGKAIERQFILGSTYQYTYNHLPPNGLGSGVYFQGNADMSGNVAGLLMGADVRKGRERTLFGAVFSQYAKMETDSRGYLKSGLFSVWANRLIVGVGVPYGNSRSMPFIKQFFSGGNNSLRAFRSRSVGPGTYLPPGYGTQNFLPDQSGDIKLELNTEYRAKLWGILNGAAFVDMGNIWLLNNDSLKPGATFTKTWHKELAVGTGLGLRIDISFLVLRLDVAFPLRKPYRPDGERWVADEIDFANKAWRKENIIYNLAIGYPF